MNLRFGLAFVAACALVTTAGAQNVDHFEQTLVSTNNLGWSACPTAGTYFFLTPPNSKCLQTRVLPVSQNPAVTHYVYQLVREIKIGCKFSDNKNKQCRISVLRVCSPSYAPTPQSPAPPDPATLSACKKPIGSNRCSVCMHAEEVI